MSFKGFGGIDIVWTDKKRILGMPISFTRYMLSRDRIFIKSGFFTTNVEEILLYRVRDLTFRQTLWQKIFGVGSVIIQSTDKTNPECELKNIKTAFEVKEMLHASVEEMKKNRKMRMGEFLNDDDGDFEEE